MSDLPKADLDTSNLDPNAPVVDGPDELAGKKADEKISETLFKVVLFCLAVFFGTSLIGTSLIITLAILLTGY